MAKKLKKAQSRVIRLTVARDKMLERMERFPDDQKFPVWERKVGEYEQSIRNLKQTGKEGDPSVNTSVSIDVPIGKFGIAFLNEGKE